MNPLSAQAPTRRKDIPTITKESSGAVVVVIASDKGGKTISQGSGFLVSRDGRVITNYHVIEDAKSAIIKLDNGAFYSIAGLVAADEGHDVAVLKADGKGFPTLSLGDSARMQVGEEVVAIGNPLSLETTVSSGIVSAIRQLEGQGSVLQITAPISPGSSGGPLFNMRGEVIGITAFQVTRGQNLNFAIPINVAKQLLVDPDLEVRDLPGVHETVNLSLQKPATAVAAQSSSVPEKVWKNLQDGEQYRTRVLEDKLYIEHVSAGVGTFETCEFSRAVSMGIGWIGKCWQKGVTTALGAVINSLSDSRIEGNEFILIPAE
jgi:S1-C subfamily serine protease